MVRITCLFFHGCLFSGTASLVDAFSIANLWHEYFEGEDAEPLFHTEIDH